MKNIHLITTSVIIVAVLLAVGYMAGATYHSGNRSTASLNTGIKSVEWRGALQGTVTAVDSSAIEVRTPEREVVATALSRTVTVRRATLVDPENGQTEEETAALNDVQIGDSVVLLLVSIDGQIRVDDITIVATNLE